MTPARFNAILAGVAELCDAMTRRGPCVVCGHPPWLDNGLPLCRSHSAKLVRRLRAVACDPVAAPFVMQAFGLSMGASLQRAAEGFARNLTAAFGPPRVRRATGEVR